MYKLIEILLLIMPLSYYIKKIEVLYVILISYFTFLIIFKEHINILSLIKNKQNLFFTMFMICTVLASINLIYNDLDIFLKYKTQYIRMWTYYFIYINMYIVILKYGNTITDRIINIILISSIIPNLIGLIQLKVSIFTTIISEQGTYRIGSTFAHPNFYGYFLCIVIIALLYKIKNKNSKILIIYMIVNLFLLVKTESRTTLFLSIFIIMINIFRKINKSNSKLKIPIIIVLILIGIITFIFLINNDAIVNSRFNLKVDDNMGSFNWRVMKWITSIEYWIKNPVSVMFGLGWMTSFVYTSNILYVGYAMHNEFIRILFETGLVGFFSYIAFLFYVFKDIITLNNKCKLKNFFRDIYILFIIGSLTGNLLGVPENTMYFFLIFACVAKKNYTYRGNDINEA